MCRALLFLALPTLSVALATPGARPVRHFINLSNGAEVLRSLKAGGVSPDAISFMRVQSSHCEAQDFNGLLNGLDHNLLMHLALGFDCRVYDFGSRGNQWLVEGSDDETEHLYVPRAVWWGLEWTRFALSRMWRLPEQGPPLLRGYNVQRPFEAKLNELPKSLAKRLKYYRSHLAPDLDTLHLRGYYAPAAHDGEKEVYREMLVQHARDAADWQARGAGSAPPDPSDFAVPMRYYDAQAARRVGME